MAASILIDGATTLKTFIFQKYEKYQKFERKIKSRNWVSSVMNNHNEFHVETRKWNYAEEDLDST